MRLPHTAHGRVARNSLLRTPAVLQSKIDGLFPIRMIDENIDVGDKSIFQGLLVVGEQNGSLDWHKCQFVLRIALQKGQR